MTVSRDAAGPAVGYQFQSDYALYELMGADRPGAALTLEMHDDVAWEQTGTALELLQVKHSVNSQGGLGDRAVALWKTLDVWMSADYHTDPNGPRLHLVSTGVAAEGTAAFALRQDTHDPTTAVRLLLEAARGKGNADTLAIRKKFLDMAPSARNTFISKVFVFDRTAILLDLDAAIRTKAWSHLPDSPEQADAFMDELWGWWRKRAIEMLTHRFYPDRENLRPRVTSAELATHLRKLTVDFSEKGLPEFDEFDVDTDDDVLAGLTDEPFVHQLHFIDYHQIAMRRAIVDYYRAFNSETRWLEHDFVLDQDVARYERKLVAAWEVAFGHMLTRLGAKAIEEQQVAAGQDLISTLLENSVPARILPLADQDFYYRGKHHMLAQSSTIGWHPDFKAKVTALLSTKVSA